MRWLRKEDWRRLAGAFRERCQAAREAFLAACDDPGGAQRRALAECIQPNRDTEFGRAHGFSGIREPADYRRQVPIRDYDELSPWIDRAVAGGERVLTAEPPNLWLRTSGTTGPSKTIPQTPVWRHRFRGPAIYAQWAAYLLYHPELADHSHATMDLSWERDTPTHFLGRGVPYQAITHREASLGGADWTPPWHDAPWFSYGAEAAQYGRRMYLRLRHFVGRDLRAIVAVNPSTPIVLANHLAASGPELAREIFEGTVFGGKASPPDRTLARALERMISRSGALRPREVWPRLNLVVCWRSASAALYADELRSLYPHAELLPFSTTGTEGVVTLPVDRHPTAGVLAVTQGFYELLPHDEHGQGPCDPHARTLLPDELTVGRDYRLVLTQANGLYRYAVGDVYRVLEYVGGVPRLEYIARDGVFSSFTGEKLTEAQVAASTQAALRARGVRAARFTCCPTWARPPRYTLVVEPDAPLSAAQQGLLARELDLQLSAHNDEYGSKRASGRLDPPAVEVVEPRTFQRYWDERVAAGASAAQLKHLWLQRDDAILAHLRRIGGGLRAGVEAGPPARDTEPAA
ncbi:MAG TPA: GH3 auxin-responsive promoter family protein [Myxococcaceae bacterium]|jgi:hypothetical protein